MRKNLVSAAVAIALTACGTEPMHADVLRAHAERNCRVEATVNKAYAIDSNGIGMDNVAYESCMARRGYLAAK